MALTGGFALYKVAISSANLRKNGIAIGDFSVTSFYRYNPYHFPLQLHLPYSVRNESDIERRDRQPLPLVVLFGGNGMGAVRRSEQTSHLAHALNRQGMAALEIPYPAQVSSEAFQKSIISRINDFVTSREMAYKGLDSSRIAFAGFSAGGLLATLLATKYNHQMKFRPVAAVNYYGPVDLRLWFAFHQVRAAAQSANDFFRGQRGALETGHSAGGPIRCDDLSRSVIAKVSENMGGLRPGSLAPFSQQDLWFGNELASHRLQHAAVLGVFGRKDDNCDALFQSKLMERLAKISGTGHEFRLYDGPHGMHWDACGESLDWLKARLTGPASA
ncbi:MAG: alpha/beta hydrolase [bacterium]